MEFLIHFALSELDEIFDIWFDIQLGMHIEWILLLNIDNH